MEPEKGQESGHREAAHSVDAFTWREYVLALQAELGGWVDLARALQDRAGDQVSEDTQTVERGLRRLARRHQKPGGKYQKLLLKHFGLPPSIERWGRLMGQYHSRFADLPVGLRRQQLLRWDRPPVSETPAAMWVHVGLASIAHRARDLDAARQRLSQAAEVPRPPVAARLERLLLAARIASDDGRLDDEADLVKEAAGLLDEDGLSSTDRACYTARLVDQRAFAVSRQWRDNPARLGDALELYESVPVEGAPPFALFRRELGRAWCLWRMGDAEAASSAARVAYDHAGDGGFVRLRIMALNLMAAILGKCDEAEVLRRRAKLLAEELEDDDLLERLARHLGGTRTDTTP